MQFHYAQISKAEDGYGYIVSDSYLSGEVKKENMIPLEMGFDLKNKRWNYETKEWETYEPKREDGFFSFFEEE